MTELTMASRQQQHQRRRPKQKQMTSIQQQQQQQQQQEGGHLVVRPTGLTEALWACVLDDYLSEEEEGEFNKILGNNEKAPWYLRPEVVACAAAKPGKPLILPDGRLQRMRRRGSGSGGVGGVDPRDARARGGRDLDSLNDDDIRDGTPGVWDEASTPDIMPPVMWLSVPPSPDDAKQQEPDWDSDPIADWDTPTDWDMNVKLQRIRQLQKKQQQKGKRTEPEDASSDTNYQSATASMTSSTKPGSRESSLISDVSPKTMSRLNLDHTGSRSSKSMLKSRSRSQTRDQQQRGNKTSSKKNWESLLEARQQSEQSRRETGRPRRQSSATSGNVTIRRRSTSPRKDSRKAKPRGATLPFSRTMSISRKRSSSKSGLRTKQQQYVM